MKKYLTYFTTVFKVNTAYRTGLFLGMFIDLIFFTVQFSVWKTVFTYGGVKEIGSYTLANTISYYFITNLIFRFDFVNSIYLGWQIWSGFFTNDLIKPWRVILVNIIDSLGENAMSLLLSIPVTVGLYFFVREYIVFPSLPYFILFVISLLIGFTVTILFTLIIHSLTLYFGDQEANLELFGSVTNLLAGAVVPLSFLPLGFQKVVEFLPFKFIFFLPCEIFLQKISIPEIYQSWSIGFIWIAGLIIALKILFLRGLKYYTGTGR